MAPKSTGCGAIILSTHYTTKSPLLEQLGDELKILLVQRGHQAKRFPGKWTPPTGTLEEGETVVNTLIRELDEELGMTFTPDQKSLHTQMRGPLLMHYHLGMWGLHNGDISLKTSPTGVIENIGFGWFSLKEALSLSRGFVYERALQKLIL